mgnify:CR=1 FL=1
MSEFILYGASDDLIEIDGDVRAEFYSSWEDDKDYIAFSTGLLLSVEYNEQGIWRIQKVSVPEELDVKVYPANSERAKDVLDRRRNDYQDVAVTEGPKPEWVAKGEQFADV